MILEKVYDFPLLFSKQKVVLMYSLNKVVLNFNLSNSFPLPKCHQQTNVFSWSQPPQCEKSKTHS